MRYWVYLDGRAKGPFEPPELKGMEGFTPSLLVCAEGGAGGEEWVTASLKEELRALFGPKCLRCDFWPPAHSVFCNRCGSRLSEPPAPPPAAKLESAVAAARPRFDEAPPAPALEASPAPAEPETVAAAPSPVPAPEGLRGRLSERWAKSKSWAVPVGVGTSVIAGFLFVLPKISPKRAPEPEPAPVVLDQPAPAPALATIVSPAPPAPPPAPAAPEPAAAPPAPPPPAPKPRIKKKPASAKIARAPKPAPRPAAAGRDDYEALLGAGREDSQKTYEELLGMKPAASAAPAPAPKPAAGGNSEYDDLLGARPAAPAAAPQPAAPAAEPRSEYDELLGPAPARRPAETIQLPGMR